MKALSTITGLLFIASAANAQFYKDMSVGINPGVYIYQGDLTPTRTGSWKTPTFGLNFFAKKPINNFLAARLNISFAKLKGDESKYSNPDYRQQRNFAFKSPLKEFSALLVWNIRGRNYDDFGLMPYLFGGAGISFIRVQPDYSRLNAAYFGDGSDVATGLATDVANGTPRRIPVIPFGAGIEYPVSERFSLNLETSYRLAFTDYIDGFGYSANPKKNDHYHSTSVGLIYKFGKNGSTKGMGCPVLKY